MVPATRITVLQSYCGREAKACPSGSKDELRHCQIARTSCYAGGTVWVGKPTRTLVAKASRYGNTPPARGYGQPSSKDPLGSTSAVHRLDGSGYRLGRCLRHSRSPPRGGSTEDRGDRLVRAGEVGRGLLRRAPRRNIRVILELIRAQIPTSGRDVFIR